MTNEDILDDYLMVKNTYIEILKKVGTSLFVDTETEGVLINTLEINYNPNWNNRLCAKNNF